MEAAARRLSDAERERVAGVLGDGVASGRISDDTFMARLDLALVARNATQLDSLIGDLPPDSRLLRLLVSAVGLGSEARNHLLDAWSRSHLPVLPLPRDKTRRYVLGRGPSADLMLAHATVSRQHAEVGFDSALGVWTLRDLESRNGSFVNDWRLVGSQLVKPGDRLRFGALTLLLADSR